MNNITQENILKKKAHTQALAILGRARQANIPEKYLRMDKDIFSELLSTNHYSKDERKSLVSFIYDNPEELCNLGYIIIDGGNSVNRRKAGFAILFRIIACDKNGLYEEWVNIYHKLQTIKSTEMIYRNDLVEELKGYFCLFLSEFHIEPSSIHFDAGGFFDELLVDRSNNSRPTILSFEDPVSSNRESDRSNGICLSELSCLEFDSEKNPKDGILRIRVKN